MMMILLFLAAAFSANIAVNPNTTLAANDPHFFKPVLSSDYEWLFLHGSCTISFLLAGMRITAMSTIALRLARVQNRKMTNIRWRFPSTLMA